MDSLFENIGITVCKTFVGFDGAKLADEIGCDITLSGDPTGNVWTIGLLSCLAFLFMFSGGGFFFFSSD